jgi:hypothetical protein
MKHTYAIHSLPSAPTGHVQIPHDGGVVVGVLVGWQGGTKAMLLAEISVMIVRLPTRVRHDG